MLDWSESSVGVFSRGTRVDRLTGTRGRAYLPNACNAGWIFELDPGYSSQGNKRLARARISYKSLLFGEILRLNYLLRT